MEAFVAQLLTHVDRDLSSGRWSLERIMPRFNVVCGDAWRRSSWLLITAILTAPLAWRETWMPASMGACALATEFVTTSHLYFLRLSSIHPSNKPRLSLRSAHDARVIPRHGPAIPLRSPPRVRLPRARRSFVPAARNLLLPTSSGILSTLVQSTATARPPVAAHLHDTIHVRVPAAICIPRFIPWMGCLGKCPCARAR